MSQFKSKLKHPVSGKSKDTYEGWSWPAFFFTPIWLFIKGFAARGIMYFLVSFLTFGIGGLIYSVVAGVKGNEWYYDRLIEEGYEPTDSAKNHKELLSKG